MWVIYVLVLKEEDPPSGALTHQFHENVIGYGYICSLLQSFLSLSQTDRDGRMGYTSTPFFWYHGEFAADTYGTHWINFTFMYNSLQITHDR